MTGKALRACVLAVLLASVIGSAASLNVSGGSVQQGNDGDLRCDEDGVFIYYTVDGSGQVTAISISDIATDCFGGTLRVETDEAEGCPCFVGSISATTHVIFPSPIPLASLDTVSVSIFGQDEEPPNLND